MRAAARREPGAGYAGLLMQVQAHPEERQPP
jgi:hypothetical protein